MFYIHIYTLYVSYLHLQELKIILIDYKISLFFCYLKWNVLIIILNVR